jgi:hypothetical protein
MVIAGIITFLFGVVLMGLGLTVLASANLLLFGIIITGAGMVLLYLAAKLN